MNTYTQDIKTIKGWGLFASKKNVLENIFVNAQGFEPTLLNMAAPVDGNSLKITYVCGMDDDSDKVAVAHITTKNIAEIRCYDICDLKEPSIIYDWHDIDIKTRQLDVGGAIVGGIYGGLPGAIGGALLASSKRLSKEKTLWSLQVKIESKESSEDALIVPLFVAATLGWEYTTDSKEYIENTKAKLDAAVKFANKLTELYWAHAGAQLKIGSPKEERLATEKELGLTPLDNENVLFSAKCKNRGTLFYYSEDCRVILTNKRLVFRDNKKAKYSYIVHIEDLKGAQYLESLGTDLKIKTATGKNYAIALEEGERFHITQKEKKNVDLVLGKRAVINETEDTKVKESSNNGVEIDQEGRYKYSISVLTRGASHADKGEYDDAIKDYKSSLQICPNKMAFHNLGLTYIEKDMYKESIEEFSKAIQLDPEYAPAWIMRCRAYLRVGDEESARIDLEQTEKLKNCENFYSPQINEDFE